MWVLQAIWVLQALGRLLSGEETPGTPAHREAYYRSIKERIDEAAKPPGQRDEARLHELTKRVLRLRIENCQVVVERLDGRRG